MKKIDHVKDMRSHKRATACYRKVAKPPERVHETHVIEAEAGTFHVSSTTPAGHSVHVGDARSYGLSEEQLAAADLARQRIDERRRRKAEARALAKTRHFEDLMSEIADA